MVPGEDESEMSESYWDIHARWFDEATDKAKSTMDSLAGETEKVAQKTGSLTKATDASTKSTKDVALAANNMITAATSLYFAYDNLEKAQLNINKAQTAAKAAANNLEDAQKKYNDAVTKFGADSPEAVAAQKDLEIAQERSANATDRAEILQKNYGESVTRVALMAIPSLITMVTSASTVLSGLGGVMTLLSTHPILIVLGVLIGIFVLLYTQCKPFRDLIDNLANVVLGTLQKAWENLCAGMKNVYDNVLKPVFDALTWVWEHVIQPLIEGFKALTGWGTSAAASTVTIPGVGGTTTTITPGNIPHFQHGFEGMISRPTLFLAGEAGAESVSIQPTGRGRSGGVTINGPLIVIQGSADRATAEAAAKMIISELSSVIVEPSSTYAVATGKRIRKSRIGGF